MHVLSILGVEFFTLDYCVAEKFVAIKLNEMASLRYLVEVSMIHNEINSLRNQLTPDQLKTQEQLPGC